MFNYSIHFLTAVVALPEDSQIYTAVEISTLTSLINSTIVSNLRCFPVLKTYFCNGIVDLNSLNSFIRMLFFQLFSDLDNILMKMIKSKISLFKTCAKHVLRNRNSKFIIVFEKKIIT